MIVIPKSACLPCGVVNNTISSSVLPPVDSCPPCEEEIDEEPSEPVVSFLCPCPVPDDPIVIPVKRKFKTTIVKSCYADFVLALSTTKFCDVGPKCR